jgi:ATP-dependent Zn protease
MNKVNFEAVASRSPGYPVVGRSAEYNRRIAIHEAGHAYMARCMGTELRSVSIIPGDGFEGRCLSTAYQSSLYEAPEDKTVEIVDLCERAQRLMPELGTGRVEAAEFFQRATVLCIELVGGTVAEQILYPQVEPLPTLHDQIEAAAFAGLAVSSPRAVPAFLEYAKGEAAALINDHPDVAMAIADALVEHGILTGVEVDAVIAGAIAREDLNIENERRKRWAGVKISAARFAAGLDSTDFDYANADTAMGAA